MHLHYQDNCSEEVMVLVNNHSWCVEMYVLANRDATYSLVALAGVENQVNHKTKVQGPYQNRSEAIAARSAIVASLGSDGFSQSTSRLPRWRLAAQKIIRELREVHRHPTDCAFKPDDVYFD